MELKVGFICEGESDEIILRSPNFQNLLQKLDLKVVEIIPTGGKSQMEEGRILRHYEALLEKGAEKIILLKDGDDNCKESKQKVGAFEHLIVTIAVRELESWFLADSNLLSNLAKANTQIEFPELEKDPKSFINTVRKKTFKGSPPALANSMVINGFSIENAANHPNCPSAKYFIKKLESLNQ
jgi:hypothetical protein